MTDRDNKGKFSKGNSTGFKKGSVPKNKIQDEFSDLPISRQHKHWLRKKKDQEAK